MSIGTVKGVVKVLLAVSVVQSAGINPGASAIPSPPGSQGFISISNGVFVDSQCNEFFPIGWNSWVSFNKAAASAIKSLPQGQAGLDSRYTNQVTDVFKAANQYGFTAVRLFLHGEDSSFQLQTGPGSYDESAFRAIDYILAVAGLHGVKVIAVPVNNWLEAGVGGGKKQYMSWAGISAYYEDTFWTNSQVRSLIKQHFGVLTSRKNVYNGRAYKDDDTIFAWDVYNEPRCPDSQNGVGCPGPVTDFYRDLSAALKYLAPNHLVTTGEEGFFVVNTALANADPTGIPSNAQSAGRFWSAKDGQDFVAQSSLPSIDFAGFHLWPDNWVTYDASFPGTWITAHEQAAASIGKPLVLEEFGKGSSKQATYQAVYQALQDSIARGGPLKGVLFWRWDRDGGNDETTVYTGDQIFQLIQGAISKLKPYLGRDVSSCTPKTGVQAFG